MEKKLNEDQVIKRFIPKPNLTLKGGIIVKKDIEFRTQTKDGHYKQTLKDNILTTITRIKETRPDGRKASVQGKVVEELKEGTVLIWTEAQGYVAIDDDSFITLEEFKESVEVLEDVKNDLRGE